MNDLMHAIPVVNAGDYGGLAHRSKALLLETLAVTIGTLAIVRFLYTGSVGNHWLLIPGTLVAAALIPTWVARRGFPRIGLHAEPLRQVLRTVMLTSLCILPPVFLGLWLLTAAGLPVPLRPVLGGQQNWLTWLLYQFLYVAAAEEVFFRGYLQANVMNWLGMWNGSRARPRATREIIAIAVSAGCFALAHVVIQGRILSALTFLPGLIMAWLFVRTRSLLAPILFHGLANVSYGIMAATFA